MAQKYCRKFQSPEYGARTLRTDDRQTDGRAIAYYSEREREFTFAKKEHFAAAAAAVAAGDDDDDNDDDNGQVVFVVCREFSHVWLVFARSV